MSLLYNYAKKTYYTLLDFATLKKGVNVKLNNFPIKMPARYYRYFPKDYEKENFEFFKTFVKPGFTCIDVGAHFGVFSVYMHKTGHGKVYAFEPTHSTQEIMKETLKINKCEDEVEMIPAAVDEKEGEATFFVSDVKGAVFNSLINYKDDSRKQTGYQVKITSIDNFVKERGLSVNFIKIDAEGAELGVLKGAANTLASQKPYIIFALHPASIAQRNDSLEEIWDCISHHGYTVELGKEVITKESFCSHTDLFDVHLIPSY